MKKIDFEARINLEQTEGVRIKTSDGKCHPTDFIIKVSVIFIDCDDDHCDDDHYDDDDCDDDDCDDDDCDDDDCEDDDRDDDHCD